MDGSCELGCFCRVLLTQNAGILLNLFPNFAHEQIPKSIVLTGFRDIGRVLEEWRGFQIGLPLTNIGFQYDKYDPTSI
jgi:hypothetical protein